MQIKQGLEEQYNKYKEDSKADPISEKIALSVEKVGDLLDNPKNKPYTAEMGLRGLGLTEIQGGSAIATLAFYHPRGEEMQKYWNNKMGF